MPDAAPDIAPDPGGQDPDPFDEAFEGRRDAIRPTPPAEPTLVEAAERLARMAFDSFMSRDPIDRAIVTCALDILNYAKTGRVREAGESAADMMRRVRGSFHGSPLISPLVDVFRGVLLTREGGGK